MCPWMSRKNRGHLIYCILMLLDPFLFDNPKFHSPKLRKGVNQKNILYDLERITILTRSIFHSASVAAPNESPAQEYWGMSPQNDSTSQSDRKPFVWAPASKSKKKLYSVKPVLHRHVIPFNMRHLKADCFACRSTIVPREATPKPKGFLQVIQHRVEIKHHGTRKFKHL